MLDGLGLVALVLDGLGLVALGLVALVLLVRVALTGVFVFANRRTARLVIVMTVRSLVACLTIPAVLVVAILAASDHTSGSVAAEDVGSGHGHGPVGQRAASKGGVGKGHVARENGALKRRSLHGRVLTDPPERVTWVGADDSETGGRKGSGATSPNFEDPRTAAGEGQGARQRRRRWKTVDACPQVRSGKRVGDAEGLCARAEMAGDPVVSRLKVAVSGRCDLRLHGAPGRGDRGARAGNSDPPGDDGVGARQPGAVRENGKTGGCTERWRGCGLGSHRPQSGEHRHDDERKKPKLEERASHWLRSPSGSVEPMPMARDCRPSQ